MRKKNLIVFALFSLIAITSCSNSASGVSAGEAQTLRADVLKLKGSWTVSNVDFDRSYSVKPFDEGVSIDCFVGSSWTLVPNNYTGTYSLHSSAACPEKTQKITFSVDKNSVVSIKKVADGEKAKHVGSGYKLILENPTENNFTLLQSVNVGGSAMDIRYRFERTSK